MVNMTAFTVGVGFALAMSAVHFVAHTVAGEEEEFKTAGVREAGVTVALASFILAYTLVTGDLVGLFEWVLNRVNDLLGIENGALEGL